MQLMHSNTPTHNYETMQKNHMNYVPNACSQGKDCLIMAQLAHFSWEGHNLCDEGLSLFLSFASSHKN